MTTEAIIDAPAGEATADASDEILQLFHRWNDALTTGGPARVAALYGPGAVLVPTLSNTLRTTPDEILAYFEKLIRELKPRVTLVGTPTIRFFGTTAISSGIYTFHFDANGKSADARYTFAYHRTGGGWLISAHHSSLLYKEMVAGKAGLDPSF
ncbi:MAG TPA: SgcJ/EcaC family oxidoreductase [Longimicrobium sp.]|nr:SgcJ/EcaC family oxidoreductase [Longimicrobium sp.]